MRLILTPFYATILLHYIVTRSNQSMSVRTNIQMDEKDYAFIKSAYKEIRYRSISEYLRDAIAAKIEQDRKTLRQSKRIEAMEALAGVPYENAFESTARPRGRNQSLAS